MRMIPCGSFCVTEVRRPEAQHTTFILTQRDRVDPYHEHLRWIDDGPTAHAQTVFVVHDDRAPEAVLVYTSDVETGQLWRRDALASSWTPVV